MTQYAVLMHSEGLICVWMRELGFITNVSAESHIQIGALPLLLKKKKFVLERLRALEATESVGQLKEQLTEEKDTEKQKTLEEKIAGLESQIGIWLKRSEAYSKVDISENLEAAAKRAAIANEAFERKAKVWQEFLARESVATLIGAILVLLITGALLFTSSEVPSVITNAYLVIIGFFFGQSIRKSSGSSTKSSSSTGGEKT